MLTKLALHVRQVKTVTYAFLYGAGDQNRIYYDKQLSEDTGEKERKEIRYMSMPFQDLKNSWKLYTKLVRGVMYWG